MAYSIRFKDYTDRSEHFDEGAVGARFQAFEGDSAIPFVTYSFVLRAPEREKLVDALDLDGVAEEPIRRALLGFGVQHLERLLRSGAVMPTRDGSAPALVFKIGNDDLSWFLSSVRRKTCDYRLAEGGDLYCTATRGDRARPVTLPLCRACEMPDDEQVCTHLTHFSSGIQFTQGGAVLSPQAMCNRGRDEIGNPKRCAPDGHDCWERSVEREADRRSLPFAPHSLPEAMDFLDATWRLAFGKKQRLLRLRVAVDVTTLVEPCVTRKDFAAGVSALDDIMKSMVVSDDLLSEADRANEYTKGDKTLNRLQACLHHKIADTTQLDAGLESVRVLRTINRVRVALQHSGRADDLSPALADLGIAAPVAWPSAWDHLRAVATGALSDLRRVIGSVVEEG